MLTYTTDELIASYNARLACIARIDPARSPLYLKAEQAELAAFVAHFPEVPTAARAYADGFEAGKRDWSGSCQWTYSTHLDDYCRGFTAGNKLRDERISKEI